MKRKIKRNRDYEITSRGNVYSLKNGKRIKIKQRTNKAGYKSVELSKNGRTKFYYVHRLVLEAFVGSCPEGMECRHFPDRDPANNNLWNLSWSDRVTNHADKIIHGTSFRGIKVNTAKLTPKLVRRIRKLHRSKKYLQKELAKMFRVSQPNISSIVLKQSWAHVA